MDFLGHILGSDGCNVDGTVGSNPLTAFVNQAFENNFVGSFGHDSVAETVTFVEQHGIAENQAVYQSRSTVEMGHTMFNTAQPHFMHPPGMQFGLPAGGMMMMPQFFGHGMANHTDMHDYEHDQEQYFEEEEDYEYETVVHEAPAVSAEETLHAGASKEGLEQSWRDLQAKLSTGELSGTQEKSAEYSYLENNPYISQDKPLDINEMLERGKQFHREGRIREAILCFEGIVQDRSGAGGSECDEAWRMLGVCHAENDEDKRAIYCLNQCLDLDPYNLEALLGLGTSYVNELDSVKALETLRTWVAHNPRYQGLDGSALDAYSDGTLMDEVTQLVLAVAAHDPSDADVKVLLGVLYNVSTDFTAAIECFAQACEMRPDDYALINKLAASYANSSDSERAIPHYSRALQLRPHFARGWLNLGISFANLDRYEDAAKAYVQALQLNPGAKHIWNYMRIVLSCMDRFDLVPLTTSEDVEALARSLNVEILRP